MDACCCPTASWSACGVRLFHRWRLLPYSIRRYLRRNDPPTGIRTDDRTHPFIPFFGNGLTRGGRLEGRPRDRGRSCRSRYPAATVAFGIPESARSRVDPERSVITIIKTGDGLVAEGEIWGGRSSRIGLYSGV